MGCTVSSRSREGKSKQTVVQQTKDPINASSKQKLSSAATQSTESGKSMDAKKNSNKATTSSDRSNKSTKAQKAIRKEVIVDSGEYEPPSDEPCSVIIKHVDGKSIYIRNGNVFKVEDDVPASSELNITVNNNNAPRPDDVASDYILPADYDR